MDTTTRPSLPMAHHTYRIGIDIGGTFTDVVVARDDGLVETRKVPSTPDDYSRGIAGALKALIEDFETTPDAHHRHRPRHHGRHQRDPGVQGRPHRPADHRGLSRRARDAPPAHPGALRPAIRQADAAGAARHLRLEVRERMGPDGPVRVPLDEADVLAAAAALPGRRGRGGRDQLPARLCQSGP